MGGGWTRIGIDIGGSSAKVGLVDEGGAVRHRAQLPTGRDLDIETLVERLVAAVAGLRRKAPASGLGIAAPGYRSPDGDRVVNVSNLPLIEAYPLRLRMEQETGLPTVLDNDANAAALGEWAFGAGRGAARLLVVTVGTGVGAGMVVDGSVLRVSWGGLGDPGHLIARAGGPECACGGHGCLETLAAVPGTLRRAAELGGAPFAGLGELVEAARAGNAAARQALRESGELLGVGLATLTHLFGPERILLGGGAVDAAGDLLIEPAREALFRHVQPFLAGRLTLGRAELGNDAGIVGAASLAPPASGLVGR